MEFNLPIFEQLAGCRNVLIAGMGGGFDVFCGLPIYFELRRRGLNAHLANYSFSEVDQLSQGFHLTEMLVGVTAEITGCFLYFPELHLARWLKSEFGEDIPIWAFPRTGVRPLLDNYAELVDYLKIDAIILIDGGVDSLMRGDEHEIGTLGEDSVSLIAVSDLDNVPVRLVACTAFGAEEAMSYEQVFENMAALIKLDAYLGSCALTQRMDVYQTYEEAVLAVQRLPTQDASVINSSIISAVHGEFGNFHLTAKTYGSHLWISPLMPIYWFFELDAVAQRTLLYSALRYTDTIQDVFRALVEFRQITPTRPPTRIPLT